MHNVERLILRKYGTIIFDLKCYKMKQVTCTQYTRVKLRERVKLTHMHRFNTCQTYVMNYLNYSLSSVKKYSMVSVLQC